MLEKFQSLIHSCTTSTPNNAKQLLANITTHGLLHNHHHRHRNTLIRASTNSHNFHLALHLYSSMFHMTTSSTPDNFTFPFVLNSCAALHDLLAGRIVHRHTLALGFNGDVYVAAALVDMYAKCGWVPTARKVFDGMVVRDLVSWTTMVSGYAHNGYGAETLEMAREMMECGFKMNRVALLSVLLASGQLGELRIGEVFCGYTIRGGFENDTLVATAIMDMFAKCGSLDSARLVFDGVKAEARDVVCWSSMIACYGVSGQGREAIGAFRRMVHQGVRPNHVTFTSLLTACSRSGLVDEAYTYFKSMNSPNLNHYSCMVDLLGRAGKLLEAEQLVNQTQIPADSTLWGSLLGACWIHGNADIGERIADRVFRLDPSHSGYYVLLSNIFAAKSRWKDVESVRKLMVQRSVHKEHGFSLNRVTTTMTTTT